MTTHPMTTPAGGPGREAGGHGGSATGGRTGSGSGSGASGTAERTKDTAAQEAGRVGREARTQARHMWGQAREELTTQAATQQERVSTGLRDLGDQLRTMAQSGDEDSPARGLVEDAARYASDAASWLEGREPGMVLDEVRGIARRRPGAFLAAAAGLGLVAGRLSRGLADEARDAGSGSGSGQSHRAPDLSRPSSGAPERPSGAPVGASAGAGAGETDPGFAGTTTPTGEGLAAAGGPVTPPTMPTPAGAPPARGGGERGRP